MRISYLLLEFTYSVSKSYFLRYERIETSKYDHDYKIY